MATEASPPLSPLAAVIPALLLAALVVVDTSTIDFPVQHAFYTVDGGFVGRHVWWLENVVHDFLKKVVIAFGVLIGLLWLLSVTRRPWRRWSRSLGYLAVAMSLSSALVVSLKEVTGVHCPWDLREFGGAYTYVQVGASRESGEPRGRCWPAGHAATGFSLFALFFVLRDRRPLLAKRALGAVLVFGSLLALARMSQGAHFLSHNVATGLIAWLVCLMCYRLLLYRRPVPPDDQRGSLAPGRTS